MFCTKVLFLLIVVSVLNTATAVIQCYHCSSAKSGSCGENLNPLTTPKITCYDAFCNVRTLRAPQTDLIIRGCVSFADTCDDPAFYPCKTCDNNLCNDSSHVLSHYGVICTSLGLIYLTKSLL